MTVFDALIAEATEDDLKQFAERLRPFLESQTPASEAPRWLNVEQASEYLACPVSRIYSLNSAKRIPCHRDGSRLLFNPDELDQWVRNGGATRP